jgi:hypothetical protein
MPTSRVFRTFVEESANLRIVLDAARNNRIPAHDLDANITARFGTLTHGERRSLGKVIRAVIEANGGRHQRTGVLPVKPQINAASTYVL